MVTNKNTKIFQDYPVQLKVTATKDNQISVFLHMPEQPYASARLLKFDVVVKLLNQISDGEHCTITDKSPVSNDYLSHLEKAHQLLLFDTKPEKAHDQLKQFFITNEDLTKKTDTCEFLQDNTIFFEVLVHEED